MRSRPRRARVDPARRPQGEQRPAVDVKEGQGLDRGAVAQVPLCDVALPHLVGLLGLEVDEARPRPLPRLRPGADT